jgi:phenylalanyl-tRNA synthetase beta subunit
LLRPATFSAAQSLSQPWEPEHRSADVSIGDIRCGRVGVLPLALKRTVDEHLAAWSVAWAELELDELARLDPAVEKLAPLPEFPQVELDFSFVVPAVERYVDVRARLAAFAHPLLRRWSYVGAYEGKSVGEGLRSLTVRARIGSDDRTLTEADSSAFASALEAFLKSHGYRLRG